MKLLKANNLDVVKTCFCCISLYFAYSLLPYISKTSSLVVLPS